jgi:hypothetical protein
LKLTTPTDFGENHRRLFELARAVKTLESKFGKTFSQEGKRNIFEHWHRRSIEFLRNGRDEYWFEFLEAYENVRYTFGDDLLCRAWERAQSVATPPEALQFESKELRLLVSLCRELQLANAEEPFFLATRTVQRLFNHDSHTTAALWLKGLCRTGILAVVEKGGPDTNRATRYRYVASLSEPKEKP